MAGNKMFAERAQAMTPVERIARALAVEDGKFDPELVWQMYIGRAQAALSALLEPSEAMVEAGADAVFDFMDDKDLRDIWSAMIQAAIAEGRG